MRKRVTYRPGKAQGAFGTIWGGIFVLIGLFVVIPHLWTVWNNMDAGRFGNHCDKRPSRVWKKVCGPRDPH